MIILKQVASNIQRKKTIRIPELPLLLIAISVLIVSSIKMSDS